MDDANVQGRRTRNVRDEDVDDDQDDEPCHKYVSDLPEAHEATILDEESAATKDTTCVGR